MTTAPLNLSARLAAGETLIGAWISLDSVCSVELIGQAGFDWGIVDLEHGHFDGSRLLDALRAADAVRLPLVVRVPEIQPPLIGRCLDWGAAGIMAPNVHTPQHARQLVEAMRFAPLGKRGLSRSVRAGDYGSAVEPFLERQATALAIAQIESPVAVQHAHEIAAMDGIDVLFLGHTDLSQSLGCLGNLQDGRIVEAEETLLRACAAAGKKAGMVLAKSTDGPRASGRGFRFFTATSDLGLLRSGLQRARIDSSSPRG